MTDSLLRVDSSRNRSETRSTSNQPSRRTSSAVSQSVQSWVLSTQQNPPPPPPEHATTPLHTTHRLPQYSYPAPVVQSQGFLPHPPLQVMNPSETVSDEAYYAFGANHARLGNGYLNESLGRMHRNPMENPASITRGTQGGTRNKSVVSGFVSGLKGLPRRMMGNRNNEKGRPALIAEEGDSTEAVTTLPRYRSNPSTPIAGPQTVTYIQATEMPVPELRDRLPADALRSVRYRHPSYRVTPPSVHDLAEEQAAQIYDMPPADPPTFEESAGPPTPQPEADQATTLFYDNPDATSIGQPQSQSLRISYISHHTPNTRVATLNPTTPQHVPSQIPSEAQDDPAQDDPAPVQSPVLAHPPLSNDYRKMSLASHDARSRTTYSSSCSLEPSFSSELSPVRRFLHIIQSLPWVANERITSDYNPGGSDKDAPKKKPLISWYRRTEPSGKVNLLSAGSPDSPVASTATLDASPRLEPRRVRRSHSHLQPHRHQHGHSRHQRHHRHRHAHGHHRQRYHNAAAAATDDGDVAHVHKPSPVIPSAYPPQFTYAYQYPFPPPTAPRGPRSRHSPAYPGGYVPFQPMPSSPPMPGTSPVYFVPANAQSQGSVGEGFPVQGQPMYVVPGTFHHNDQTYSPSSQNQDLGANGSQHS